MSSNYPPLKSPGKVPMPEIAPDSENAPTENMLLPAIIALGLILLILLLLLFAMRPQTTAGSGGGLGAGGAGTGSQIGDGAGNTGEHSGNDGHREHGDQGKHDVETGPGNRPDGRDETIGNDETAPDSGKEGDLFGNEAPQPKSSRPEGDRLEAEPVPDEPSLGERIAANLANAPPPQSDEGGAGSGDGGVLVQVFGLGGYGSSFVFVFDRSSSMSGRKIREAKNELLESLSVLNEKHRFNIIFYDSAYSVWKPEVGLVTAGAKEKKDAAVFVEAIVSQGGTSHLPPLLEAIGRKPDVIFFLTDGQSLTEPELARITGEAGKICIHVIQFAEGGESRSEILRQLAAQNRGRYKYVNASTSDAL